MSDKDCHRDCTAFEVLGASDIKCSHTQKLCHFYILAQKINNVLVIAAGHPLHASVTRPEGHSLGAIEHPFYVGVASY